MIGRRVFNIASVGSLVLLLAAALGVTFLRRGSDLSWIGHGTMDVRHTLKCVNGNFCLDSEDQLAPAQFAAAWARLNAAVGFNVPVERVFVGREERRLTDYWLLVIKSGDVRMDMNSVSSSVPTDIVGGSWTIVYVPFWETLALFSILPLLWGWRMVARLRQPREGLCVTCSYDLTGNTSGVCPECGIAIAKT